MTILTQKNKKNVELDLQGLKEFIEENVNDFKNFTPDLLKRMEFFLEETGKINITNLRRKIIHLVNNTQRKINSNNLNYWIGRGFTEEEAIEKVAIEQRKKSKRCKEYWLSKGYTEEEAKKEISEHQRKSSDIFKERHTKEELGQFFQENSCWNKKFWIKKGYTEEKSILIVSSKQRNNANKIDYEKRICHFEKDYWINNGYSEQEAKKILTERSDTRSLESNIARYGPIEGVINFERQIKNYKNTVDNFSKEKREDINSRISNSMKKTLSKKPFQRQSKIGKIFCVKLYRELRREGIVNTKADFLCYANGEKCYLMVRF